MELESLTTEQEYGDSIKFKSLVGRPPVGRIGNEFLCPRDHLMTKWGRCKVIAYADNSAKVQFRDGYETWFRHLSEFRHLDGTPYDKTIQENMGHRHII